jgi:hypothetical protein
VVLSVATAFYMIVLGSVGSGDLTHWIYTGGLFTLIGLLTASALPTIAYATTFGPAPPEVPATNSNNRNHRP